MLGRLKIFVVLALFCPWSALAATESDVSFSKYFDLITKLGWENSADEDIKELFLHAKNINASAGEISEELKQNYEDLKVNEQSLANRTLTAASVAATGIGGMELAMGLSEQKADKEADQNMSAYIETFRCSYGDGKQVKASADPIELPGGNDDKIMQYRSEYFALANDLKERKEALGMKPGIEAEEILDKSQMGLYDDENIGITGGAYESLYRAKMLGSEEDQAKINEMAEASSKRVKGGAIAAAAGVVGGIVGNMAINKDAPKDRSNEILKERDTVTKEIKNVIDDIIENCNAGIELAQNCGAICNQIDALKVYATPPEGGWRKIETIEDLLEIKDKQGYEFCL